MEMEWTPLSQAKEIVYHEFCLFLYPLSNPNLKEILELFFEFLLATLLEYPCAILGFLMFKGFTLWLTSSKGWEALSFW